MWGPKYSDIDVPEHLDKGKDYPANMFHTFKHTNKDDCIARGDDSKPLIHEPVFADGKVK